MIEEFCPGTVTSPGDFLFVDSFLCAHSGVVHFDDTMGICSRGYAGDMWPGKCGERAGKCFWSMTKATKPWEGHALKKRRHVLELTYCYGHAFEKLKW